MDSTPTPHEYGKDLLKDLQEVAKKAVDDPDIIEKLKIGPPKDKNAAQLDGDESEDDEPDADQEKDQVTPELNTGAEAPKKKKKKRNTKKKVRVVFPLSPLC